MSFQRFDPRCEAGCFRDIFIPDGQVLRLGSYLGMPGLAEVLEAGLGTFYHGGISQEEEVIFTPKGSV